MANKALIREMLPFEAVAKRLSGRSTAIIWAKKTGSLGHADRKGLKAEITLDPELDGIEEIKVFLHEVGHLKNDFHKISDSAANPDYERPAPSTRLEGNV